MHPCAAHKPGLHRAGSPGALVMSGEGAWRPRPSPWQQWLESSWISWQSSTESWQEASWAGLRMEVWEYQCEPRGTMLRGNNCQTTVCTTNGRRRSLASTEASPSSLSRLRVFFLHTHYSQHKCSCTRPLKGAGWGMNPEETKHAKQQQGPLYSSDIPHFLKWGKVSENTWSLSHRVLASVS